MSGIVVAAAGRGQQRRDVAWRGAIHADRDDARGARRERHGILDRFAGRGRGRVAALVRQPRRRARAPRRDRPAPGPRACVGIVSIARRSAPASSSASIRGAWTSRRAASPGIVVAADTRSRRRASRRTGRPSPPRRRSVGRRRCLGREPVARPLGQLDRSADGAERRVAVQTGRREALDRRLVARRRRDLRTCPEVGEVDASMASGSSSRSRADQSRSHRSWPRASSSVASPPSRIVGAATAIVAGRHPRADRRPRSSRRRRIRRRPRNDASAHRMAATRSWAVPAARPLDRLEQAGACRTVPRTGP